MFGHSITTESSSCIHSYSQAPQTRAAGTPQGASEAADRASLHPYGPSSSYSGGCFDLADSSISK